MSSWKKTEGYARSLAEIMWHKPAKPDRIDGVNFDAVIRVSDDEIVLIEITEEYSLEKIRTDVAKISPVKIRLAADSVVAKSFIILAREPTQGMIDIGNPHKIKILSIDSFAALAFSYPSYVSLRDKLPFGSAINPATGEPDDNEYVPVSYVNSTNDKKYSVTELCARLVQRDKLVLLGDYGTGKSRCVREVFKVLSSSVNSSLNPWRECHKLLI